jgi:hypothetical protein
MKFVTRPPTDANGVHHGGDDLDEALVAFFRAEMPRPWPQLKLPDAPPARPAPPAPAPRSRSWFRSPRFALAASVALLIGGYAVMSAALTPPAPPDTTPVVGPDDKATNHNPKIVDDDDVDVKIKSLDQIGNGPGTIHIEAKYEKK